MAQLLENILQIGLISAPWLLLGLVAAGLIHAWLPMKLVGRALGGSGAGAVLRAALVGAPLPLCSCGTLPAAFSLRRSGASPASTTSFLIATPETGVDSVALSWVLLGPFMALLRPVAAIFSAVAAGLLVGRAGSTEPQPGSGDLGGVSVQAQPSCDPASRCCTDQEQPRREGQGVWKRSFEGLKYAFSSLLDDLALWLGIGIVAAAAVITLLPPDLLASWGSGPLAMLLILLISVPMYVCATASTPLAHAMLYAGVSPGTVLVFLLAGPASNLASIALVRKELGSRALLAYLVGVAGVSVFLGVLLDFTVGLFEFDILAGMAAAGGEAGEAPTLIAWLSLAVLLVTGIRPLRRFLTRGKGGEDGGCCG
jgi:uncharacterized membrane protein YraQ (UPF0718 family)